jgi:hypothetical protein
MRTANGPMAQGPCPELDHSKPQHLILFDPSLFPYLLGWSGTEPAITAATYWPSEPALDDLWR